MAAARGERDHFVGRETPARRECRAFRGPHYRSRQRRRRCNPSSLSIENDAPSRHRRRLERQEPFHQELSRCVRRTIFWKPASTFPPCSKVERSTNTISGPGRCDAVPDPNSRPDNAAARRARRPSRGSARQKAATIIIAECHGIFQRVTNPSAPTAIAMLQ